MPSPSGSLQWLLLVHQLPASPAYQRVKLRRRLQSLGAVAVKKAVQALPASDDALEDFLWIAKELEAAGGDAFVCEARLVEGISDPELRALFDQARDLDYGVVAKEASALKKKLTAKRSIPSGALSQARTGAARLRKQLGEIGTIDFFSANGRAAAEVALRELEERLMRFDKPRAEPASSPPPTRSLKDLQRKVWVTRHHIHVDRIACAWLIREFIDPKARFRARPRSQGRQIRPARKRGGASSARRHHAGQR